MTWDANKSDFETLDEVPADKKLTAAEWMSMVADQKAHSGRHEKGGGDEVTTFGDTVHDSIDTEDSHINRSLEREYSEYNPHVVRGAEPSGLTNLRPAPGVSQPVLKQSDVSDADASQGVADPFVRWLPSDGLHHMLFEIIDGSFVGRIAHATSPDLLTWTYDQQIAAYGDHISYPIFFTWDGDIYWVPNVSRSGSYRTELYRFDSFPTSDTKITDLGPIGLIDGTPFYWDGRWYMIGADGTDVRLYYDTENTDDIESVSFSEHPSSPIHNNAGGIEGPAGRPVVTPHYVDFYYQDTDSDGVLEYRITDLTTSSFTDAETANSPILNKWVGGYHTQSEMHHLDPVMGGPHGNQVVIADGQRQSGWQIFALTPSASPHAIGKAANDGTQSLTNLQFDPITLDIIFNNLGGGFDLANDKYVVPESGFYRFGMSVTLANGASGSLLRGRIMKNNSRIDTNEEVHMSSSGDATISFYRYDFCDPNDDIVWEVRQETGSGVGLVNLSHVTAERLW